MTIVIVILKYYSEFVTNCNHGDSDFEIRYHSRIVTYYDYDDSDFEIIYSSQTFYHCNYSDNEISLDIMVIVEKLIVIINFTITLVINIKNKSSLLDLNRL